MVKSENYLIENEEQHRMKIQMAKKAAMVIIFQERNIVLGERCSNKDVGEDVIKVAYSTFIYLVYFYLFIICALSMASLYQILLL